jgi:hypothetical protein
MIPSPPVCTMAASVTHSLAARFRHNAAAEGGWPSRFWEKALRKPKKSEQAFVGPPRNACLARLGEDATAVAIWTVIDVSALRR